MPLAVWSILMRVAKSDSLGFTLIELMVTVAVFTVLSMLAVPAFIEMRERMALRGAADQYVSFWANARMEAIKRHAPIAVTIRKSGTQMCLGATATLTGCDCFSAGACEIDQYPQDQGDWRSVTMVGKPTLGDDDTDDIGLAVIDPKRAYLATSTDVGGVTLLSKQSRYREKFYVDRWARPMLCSPTDSPKMLSELADRTCAP
jgi:prepilin-type N-terminal cleavage/methylation domain-containing protein